MAKDLLFEIGTEELPASFVRPALQELERLIGERMREARLDHGRVQRFGTPRRLALWISAVADQSPDLTREVLGPPAKVGFGADGRPTQAAEKFAGSLGLSVADIRPVRTSKGEYLSAQVQERGRPAHSIVTEALHQALHAVKFPKSMRWGDVEQTFARPVHWIVALLGEEILPVAFADVRAGRSSYGHRFLSPQAIELRNPSEYADSLERASVIADIDRRRRLLVDGLRQAVELSGGKLLEDEDLVDEVTELIEVPNPLVGSFDPKHLDLPSEVLIQEMKSHQRYFAIVDGAGKLLPKFVAVSNTSVLDQLTSLRGYQRVLSARLADGRFFFDQDRKTALADRVEKLKRVVWQEKLGNYADKVRRMRELAKFLAAQVQRPLDLELIDRAAYLSKADLVTEMVGEFPELQGVMGREYAKASGERPEVALAIFEQYLPRGAGDRLPTRDEGAVVGIADRLDSLVGTFAVGKAPTGAADPLGLRRACLAIIRVALSRDLRFPLSATIGRALELFGTDFPNLSARTANPPPDRQVLDFFRARLKAFWAEKHRPDLVEAILAVGFDHLVPTQKRLEALSSMSSAPDFASLSAAFKRVVNIVEKQGKGIAPGRVNPKKLIDVAEIALYEALGAARQRVTELVQGDDFLGALKEIAHLKPQIDRFFEQVMVMAEDKELKENRIHLLQEIRALFNQVSDFSKVQAEA